jgi:hypothetical protein
MTTKITTESELGLAGCVVIDVCASLKKMSLDHVLTCDDLQHFESNALRVMLDDFRRRSAEESSKGNSNVR